LAILDFLRRDRPSVAAIHFPGNAPPSADAFLRLRGKGYSFEELEPGDALWALHIEHPQHGSARIWSDRRTAVIDDAIRFAGNLSEAEKAAAFGSSSAIGLQVPAKRKQVLRDRKVMLRIARDLLGDDGVMVLDIGSELPWSRTSLDEELAHDADLDIESLYCLHNVFDDDGADPSTEPRGPSRWLHTHGLAELGRFDLDIVAPHPRFIDMCADPIRAIATMVLDGEIHESEPRFVFGHPGGEARLVPAAEFQRHSKPSAALLRDADGHDDRRSVLCEPAGRKLLGLGRGDRPEPLHLPQQPPREQFVIYFPTATTDLMAERAKATIGILKALTVEFQEFAVEPMVKLGYSTGDSKEHLWFSVQGFGDETLDATLENTPFAVDLQPGERADRPLELLTDWMLVTPAGYVTPRSMFAARRVREHAEEIREAMREASKAD
jgi:hypothetical protein